MKPLAYVFLVLTCLPLVYAVYPPHYVWYTSSGNISLNGSLLIGTKINWSDVLNYPGGIGGGNTTEEIIAASNTTHYLINWSTVISSSSDGNNYTTNISSTNTSTNTTVTICRQGMSCINTTFPGQVGPQGPSGSTGATGPQGPPGINGTNGTNGINGLNGTNGTNGINGLNGSMTVQSIDKYLIVQNGSLSNFSFNESQLNTTIKSTANSSGLLINWSGIGDTYNTSTQMRNEALIILGFNVSNNNASIAYLFSQIPNYALKSYCDNIATNVSTIYTIAGRAENTANISNATANIANSTANALKAINPWSNVQNLTNLTPILGATNFTGNINMSYGNITDVDYICVRQGGCITR